MLHTVLVTLAILLVGGNTVPGYAQVTLKKDTMDLHEASEKKLDAFLKRAGQKRLDIDGFMFYTNMETIPQDIFIIPYPLSAYNDQETFEENFLRAISQPNVFALEEVFMSMRWTIPTLLQELQICSSIVVDSDYPPVFNGLPLRVIYGRIMYSVQEEPLIPKPMVPTIKIKHTAKEYTLPIQSSDYGYPQLFRALK